MVKVKIRVRWCLQVEGKRYFEFDRFATPINLIFVRVSLYQSCKKVFRMVLQFNKRKYDTFYVTCTYTHVLKAFIKVIEV